MDDVLPPSSPLASSPLSSPSRPARPATPARARDSLPPSSPIPVPVPQTPSREADADEDVVMELFDSPPSPTLNALRITSRAALRALMNPARDLVLPPAPSVSAVDVEDVPIAEEDAPIVEETVTIADVVAVDVVAEDRIEGDGDVTPLVLGDAEPASEQPVTQEAVQIAEVMEVKGCQTLTLVRHLLITRGRDVLTLDLVA